MAPALDDDLSLPVGCNAGDAWHAQTLPLWEQYAATYPGKLLAVEGPNETNNFHACYTTLLTPTSNAASGSMFLILRPMQYRPKSLPYRNRPIRV
jgi:hypothetical protein